VADFLLVAGVQQRDRPACVVAALVQPARQVVRRHRRGARAPERGGASMAKGDDLRLDLGLEPGEGHRGAVALLDLERGKARIGPKLVQEPAQRRRHAGQEQVQPFRRHQERAAQAGGGRARMQRIGQGARVVDGDEMVGGNVQDHAAHSSHPPRRGT